MPSKIVIPDYVKVVIDRIEQNGYECYLVGGCVRDSIMGKLPDDYDLCTNALPFQLKTFFCDMTVIETGIKHGTVTVVSSGHNIEITTFRTESGYSDGRHPDSVSYTSSLSDDLKRRDFTVNAMAYSEKTGIVDLFGGESDIENKILRCVGDPYERFTEDSLRIMRAVRFSSHLGFYIETETEKAMLSLSDTLVNVSAERISSELKKTVCGDYFENVILKYPTLFCKIIPELSSAVSYDQKNPHHSFDLFTHLSKTVSACPKNPLIRLSALLHDIGKPCCRSFTDDGIAHYYSHAEKSSEMARYILHRLKISSKETEYIVTLIRHHDGVIDETEKAVRRKLCKIGEPMLRDLLTLQYADNVAQYGDFSYRKEHYENLNKILDKILEESDFTDKSKLAVNGNDIMLLGFQGKEIGDILSFLTDAVIDGKVKNEREILISYLKNTDRRNKR